MNEQKKIHGVIIGALKDADADPCTAGIALLGLAAKIAIDHNIPKTEFVALAKCAFTSWKKSDKAN